MRKAKIDASEKLARRSSAVMGVPNTPALTEGDTFTSDKRILRFKKRRAHAERCASIVHDLSRGDGWLGHTINGCGQARVTIMAG